MGRYIHPLQRNQYVTWLTPITPRSGAHRITFTFIIRLCPRLPIFVVLLDCLGLFTPTTGFHSHGPRCDKIIRAHHRTITC